MRIVEYSAPRLWEMTDGTFELQQNFLRILKENIHFK